MWKRSNSSAKLYFDVLAMFNSVCGVFLGTLPEIVIFRMLYFIHNQSCEAEIGSTGELSNRNNMTGQNAF